MRRGDCSRRAKPRCNAWRRAAALAALIRCAAPSCEESKLGLATIENDFDGDVRDGRKVCLCQEEGHLPREISERPRMALSLRHVGVYPITGWVRGTRPSTTRII